MPEQLLNRPTTQISLDNLEELTEFATEYVLTRPIYKSRNTSIVTAVHPEFPGVVAVKFSTELERLENEAKAGELTAETPEVVDILDTCIDTTTNLGYVVTPYTFSDLHKGLQDLRTLKSRTTVARDMARGLSAIHRENLGHRDVKPENVFLSGGGGNPAVLGDLGIVCENGHPTNMYSDKELGVLPYPDVTASGKTKLTPNWASPEQYNVGSITAKSDIFNLGLLISYIIMGVNPYDKAFKSVIYASVPERKRHAIDHLYVVDEVENYAEYLPKIALDHQRKAIRDLLGKCLSVDPTDRPDIDETIFALDSALSKV